MNIVLDWGNTYIKLGLFENQTLKDSYKIEAPKDVEKIIESYPGANLIISKTGKIPSEILKNLKAYYQLYEIKEKTRLPVTNAYKTPEMLGNDRLAGIVGAGKLFPAQNVLVIDMGSCITYDFIDKNNTYLGGAISPGYAMRFKAMHHFTAQLPELKPGLEQNIHTEGQFIGKNTEECMTSGVTYGVLGELNQMIRMYHNKFAHLKVILCGGNADFFAGKLKAAKFVIPELVLIGLNRILDYNVRTD